VSVGVPLPFKTCMHVDFHGYTLHAAAYAYRELPDLLGLLLVFSRIPVRILIVIPGLVMTGSM